MDYGRHEGDRIVQRLGDAWFEEASDRSLALEKRVYSESENRGIDPSYIFWVLYRRPQDWRKLPGAAPLNAALRLYVGNESRVRERAEPTLPEDWEGEKEVEEILKALSKWAQTDFVKELRKAFLQVVKPAAQALLQFARSQGESPSLKDAQYTLIKELPLRLRDHPHWFPGRVSTLRTMSALVLGES
jgi:hypothetical protein